MTLRERDREAWLAQKRAQGKRHRAKHRAKILAKHKLYRDQHKEEHRKYNALWREKNPDLARRHNQNSIRRRSHRAHSELMRAINAAVPRTLPQDARDDIIMAMVEARISKRLISKDIPKRAPEFIRAYWRQNDRFKTLSLDAPLPGGNGGTYMDLLEAP
jgi:hypothetical protein